MTNSPLWLAAIILLIVPLTWIISKYLQKNSNADDRYSDRRERISNIHRPFKWIMMAIPSVPKLNYFGLTKKMRATERDCKSERNDENRIIADATDRIAGLTCVIAITAIVSAAISGGSLYVIKGQLDEMRISSRAWVGPSITTFETLQLGQPLKAIIQFTNTGHEPAMLMDISVHRLWSKDEWINGTAVEHLAKMKSACMAAPPTFATRAVFPNAGISSYSLVYSTDKDGLSNKYLVERELLDGRKMLTINGCFVYLTAGKIAHTSFCYAYEADKLHSPVMNICTVGWDAN